MAENTYDDLYDSDVVDQNGNKIGGVGQVYLDDRTGLPTWVTVRTGLFGIRETFVPLQRAIITENQIQVPYDAEYVKNATNVDPDRHLDAAEEATLYKYYGIEAVEGETESETEPATQDSDSPAQPEPASESTETKPATEPTTGDRDGDGQVTFGERVNNKYDETSRQPAVKAPAEPEKKASGAKDFRDRVAQAWDGIEEQSPRRKKIDPYNEIID